FQGGDREFRDVVGQPIEFLWIKSLTGVEPFDHLAAMEIKGPLRGDAEGATPQFLLVNLFPNQFAYERSQSFGVWPDLPVDQRIQRLGWLDHFSGDELAKPGRTSLVEEVG